VCIVHLGIALALAVLAYACLGVGRGRRAG